MALNSFSAVLLSCQNHSCDMSSDEAVATPTATDTGAKDDLKRKRLDDLKELKERFAKVSRYNTKAVELEAKRLKSDSYVNHEARAEWAAAKIGRAHV